MYFHLYVAVFVNSVKVNRSLCPSKLIGQYHSGDDKLTIKYDVGLFQYLNWLLRKPLFILEDEKFSYCC